MTQSLTLPSPELEAEIHYLTEAQGGRHTPVMTGYRGQFYYDGSNWDAPQEFIDKDICELGDTVQVKLQTLSPHHHIGKFYIGKNFEVREGARIVGLGKIIQILREDFQYWDVDHFCQKLTADCQPYHRSNIKPIIQDIEQMINEAPKIKDKQYHSDRQGIDVQIRDVKTLQKLTKKAEMLHISCQLIGDDRFDAYRHITDIMQRWQNRFPYPNHLIKINVHLENPSMIELEFAICEHFYVTGKICFSIIEQSGE